MLFLLDLDETLIFSEDGNPDEWFLPRPHVVPFLNFLNEHFTLAVFSTADYDYCQEAVYRVFPFDIDKNLIFQGKYVDKEWNHGLAQYVKHKKIHKIADKLGFERNDVVILDDLDSARVTPLAKVIKAPKFEGDLNDDFLLVLKDKIEKVIEHGYADCFSFVEQLGYIAENKPEYHGLW